MYCQTKDPKSHSFQIQTKDVRIYIRILFTVNL